MRKVRHRSMSGADYAKLTQDTLRRQFMSLALSFGGSFNLGESLSELLYPLRGLRLNKVVCLSDKCLRGVPHGCASRLFAASMAFAPISRGSALPCPARRRMSNDAAGFASCYGPHRRSPIRASDAGLRPRPFPGETASLLPGLLAATRTGLTPAGDDELTNTKKHHGITSRCHPLLYWAHKKTSVKAPTTRSDSGKVPGSTWTTRCVRYVIDVALP